MANSVKTVEISENTISKAQISEDGKTITFSGLFTDLKVLKKVDEVMRFNCRPRADFSNLILNTSTSSPDLFCPNDYFHIGLKSDHIHCWIITAKPAMDFNQMASLKWLLLRAIQATLQKI